MSDEIDCVTDTERVLNFIPISFLLDVQIAGLDLNDHKGLANLCSSNANGQARYVPPHLRSGDGPEGSDEPQDEQNGGNRNYRENNYQGGYRNDQGGYQGYRNDNR